MEKLLRGKESAEIKTLFKTSFDYTSQVVLFPVRHHSPACSYHLKKVIAAYEPEVILIEGPNNANELIEDIVSDECRTPFCIYLSFDDAKGLLGEAGGKYRAYYPFLDYSPEYNALLEGKKRSITCEFIDLAYHEKLYNQQEGKALLEEGEEGDRLFTLGDYHKKLTEKMHCRSFSELWEKLFELDGLKKTTEAFAESVFSYCYYSRSTAAESEMAFDGDLAREACMKEKIQAAKAVYQKILVVTGGIHTIALTACCSNNKKEDSSIKENKEINNSYNKMPVEMPKAYLMPYSFEESDQNLGYQAGMIFPYFYQKVWEGLVKNKKEPFEEAVLGFIIQTAAKMRKKQVLSITDEMQSFYMAKGLADLREKDTLGVFELIDSVQSAFIKGERNTHYEPILNALYHLLTGMKMGAIGKTKNVPPIVLDFLAQCKIFRIPTATSLAKETKLDVYNKREHQLKSQFFHQIQFLKTDFCTYQKGQDEHTGIGRILLRETWQYRFTPKVQAVLIDQCVYGGTVREACLYLLTKSIQKEYLTAESLSSELVKAEKMGIHELYDQLTGRLIEVLGEDMNFISVAGCFENLIIISESMKLRQSSKRNSFKQIMGITVHRLLSLLNTIMQIPKEDEDKICEKLKFLYECFMEEQSQKENEFLDEEAFLDALGLLFKDEQCNNAVVGVCGGILLKRGCLNLDEVMHQFTSYLRGSQKVKKDSAAFLKGFFKVAKDTVFVEPKLLQLIDIVIRETKEEAFLEILPDLRLAFTYFLPFETDKLAKQVARLYGVSVNEILAKKASDINVIAYGKAQDERGKEALEEWFGGQSHG